MTLHPDVQRRAQAEIDHVVGKDRLPTIDDQQALPYTMALIKEVLRIAPVVPAGKENFCDDTSSLIFGSIALPHRVTQDDVYQGFSIPKGTIVIGNVWYVFHFLQHMIN